MHNLYKAQIQLQYYNNISQPVSIQQCFLHIKVHSPDAFFLAEYMIYEPITGRWAIW